MFENMRLAFQGIWSHKLRSILTMLGIIIGIAAIITIVSTIKGTNEQIKENLIGAGNNVVTVQLNQGGYPYDLSWNTPPAGVRTITQETREELEQVQGAEKVSLYTYRNYAEQVYYRNTQFNGNVMGIDENYLSVYGYQVKSGRGFTEKDYADFRKVVLADTTAVQTLFGGNNPVGETVELQGDVFQPGVFGVFRIAHLIHHRQRVAAVVINRVIQTHRRADRVQRPGYLLHRQLQRRADLLQRRIPPQICDQSFLALEHLVGDVPNGTADPNGAVVPEVPPHLAGDHGHTVGGKPHLLVGIEVGNRLHEADAPHLKQIVGTFPPTGKPLDHAEHQPQIPLDQLLPCRFIPVTAAPQEIVHFLL